MGLNNNETFSLMFLFTIRKDSYHISLYFNFLPALFIPASTKYLLHIHYGFHGVGWNYNCPSFQPSEEYRHRISGIAWWVWQSIRAIKPVLAGVVIRKESLGRVTFSETWSKKNGGKNAFYRQEGNIQRAWGERECSSWEKLRKSAKEQLNVGRGSEEYGVPEGSTMSNTGGKALKYPLGLMTRKLWESTWMGTAMNGSQESGHSKCGQQK